MLSGQCCPCVNVLASTKYQKIYHMDKLWAHVFSALVLLVCAGSSTRRGGGERLDRAHLVWHGLRPTGGIINQIQDTWAGHNHSLALIYLPLPLRSDSHTHTSFWLYLNKCCEDTLLKSLWRWHRTWCSSLRLEWLAWEQKRMAWVISIFALQRCLFPFSAVAR